MRILHVLDHSLPLQSGYVFRTLGIVTEQRRRGWDVVLLTTPKQGDTAQPYDDIEGWRFHRTRLDNRDSAVPGLGEWRQIQATTRRLVDLIGQERPDIIHAHSPALNGVPALRAGRRMGVPVVYELRAFWEDAAVDHGTTTENSLRYRAIRALESYVTRRVDRITCICEGIRGEIISRGVPAEKITVIPNAADAERFPPDLPRDADLARELGIGDDIVLGFLGSFYGYEGLPFLVEALAQARQKHAKLKLLLVGGGPDEARIRAEVERLGLQSQVILTGRVPQSEVNRYYSLVDILVFPRISKRITELVTPLKPLEGMSQRKLVMASDVGGHRELITDGDNGFLFRAGDATDFVARLGDVLDARETWDRIRDTGRAYVLNERNWQVSVDRYRDVYGPLVPGQSL